MCEKSLDYNFPLALRYVHDWLIIPEILDVHYISFLHGVIDLSSVKRRYKKSYCNMTSIKIVRLVQVSR